MARPEEPADEVQEKCPAPVIPGVGTPVVFYRTVWMHAEIGSIDRMLVEDLQEDFPLGIAI